MATETFFKNITISKNAAEIMAAESEKERKPYVPNFDAGEVERSAQEWLKRFRSKKLSEQKKK